MKKSKKTSQKKSKKILLMIIIILILAAVGTGAAVMYGKGSLFGKSKSAVNDNKDKKKDKKEKNTDADEETDSEGDSAADGFASVKGGEEGADGTYLVFPYTASDDQLVIQKMYNYGGYYIEDGSDEAVDSVAAIQVQNTSDQTIEYGSLKMTVNGTDMTFDFSLLPPGESVVVMEKNRQSCGNTADCVYGGCEIAYLAQLDKLEDQVSIETDESGTVIVTNITDNAIPELRIFYKNRLDSGEYIGGISYNVKLENLAPGESRNINPSHFDPNCGVVMMVRAYE